MFGKLAKKIAFNIVDPKTDKPIVITLAISSIIVCFMCPIMSFFGSILFGFNGIENLISKWLQTSVLNFPMALFTQIFYVGPFVRCLFKKLFKDNA